MPWPPPDRFLSLSKGAATASLFPENHMTTEFRRRAVFLDVDGTIMQNGRYIPPSTITAIRAARANGHLMFLSTGRGMAELVGPIWDIGFDGAVTNGGSFASYGDEIVRETLFSAAEVDRLRDHLADLGIHAYFQSYDQLFAMDGLAEMMAARLEGTGLPMKTFHDPAEFDAAAMAKLVFVTEDAAAAERALAELAAEFAVVSGTIPVPFWASGEVAPAGVHKGAAILDLLAHLGLDPADAIGIGDNWNDVEMFEVCGTSVAMGNAVPGVQVLADQVTSAVDEDGIHHAFLRNGLI